MTTAIESDTVTELERIAAEIRGQLVQLSHDSGTPHLASSMSCVDVMVALYWEFVDGDPEQPDDPDRDRVILSKGHAAPTLYTCLARRGYIDEEQLEHYNEAGQYLAEHPSPQHIPGVEVATGSLGHGLSLGLGMAYAGRHQDRNYDVYTVLSDGECNEGSVWEAAMLAPSKDLNNVTVIVDFNKWQATGRSQEIMQLDPLPDKWESFGWQTFEVDGHDMEQVLEAIERAQNVGDRPSAIVSNTVKGKGVSFMEDDNNWHYRKPSAEEVKQAHEELGLL
ncbi:MAG: transketolase [bacterium]